MGNRRAGVRDTAEIVGLRPTHPRMMIEEDAVPDDGTLRQDADLFHEAYWRQSMPARHLVKLGQRLPRMGLEGNVEADGFRMRILQQLFVARIDLGRRDHTEEAAGGMPRRRGDFFQRPLDAFAPPRKIPSIIQPVAVFRYPSRLAEHGRDTGTDARRRDHVKPSVGRDGQIADRRNAASEQFRKGDAICGASTGEVAVEYHQIFVERGIVEPGAPHFVPEPLVQRLLPRMRMNVDKTWHDKEIPPVDDFRAVRLQIVADRRDGLAEGDVRIFEVNVLIVLLVPHDDATGTANDLVYCIRLGHQCSV